MRHHRVASPSSDRGPGAATRLPAPDFCGRRETTLGDPDASSGEGPDAMPGRTLTATTRSGTLRTPRVSTLTRAPFRRLIHRPVGPSWTATTRPHVLRWTPRNRRR